MLRSHHFSAILPVSQPVYDWTEIDFLILLKQAVETAGLRTVGELSFPYEPQGISAIVLLEESHVALHFWPEEGKVTVDIHVCDYQQDNQQKARQLARILSFQISGCHEENHWQHMVMSR